MHNDDYAQRLITQLVDDFLVPPPAYNAFRPLLALRGKALEFACFFLTYGIRADLLRPQWAVVLGSWLVEDVMDIVDFFAENDHVRNHFVKEVRFYLPIVKHTFQSLPHLLRFDVEQATESEEWDRFHCALTGMVVHWRNGSRMSSDCGGVELTVLLDLIGHADQLKELSCAHLIDHVQNAIRVHLFPTSRFLKRFSVATTPRILRHKALAMLYDLA